VLGFAEGADGGLQVAITPYLGNSLGAMQGGAVALLADAAACRAAEARLGVPARVVELSIQFLSLVKTGPAVAGAEILDAGDADAHLRLEVRDRGADDRFCTLVHARVVPVR